MEHIPTYIRRMHGQEKVIYRHPLLEPILAETYASSSSRSRSSKSPPSSLATNRAKPT